MSTSSTTFSRRSFGKAFAATLGAGSLAALGVRTTLAQNTSLPDGAANQVANSSSGQTIANFALQFVGYPYVWAGNTPAGFDCSGFTQYVVLNTLGIDIGHGTGGQMAFGTSVSADALAPGDLLYFAGTFGDGISHAAIYIGDGMMVHAENESTGVTTSALWSDYYAAHYYGAIRLA